MPKVDNANMMKTDIVSFK